MQNIYRILFLILALGAGWGSSVFSQEQEQKPYWGKLNGSVDASFGFYKKDSLNPDLDKFGTNTYINLDYTFKNFSAGLQYEIFEPPMRGFESKLEGNKLTQYYLNYAGERYNVTVGSFFEQFGSGLTFRSYEERMLGINTSLRGVSINATPVNWIHLKAFSGQPRKFLSYGESWVSGLDGDFIVSQLWNKEQNYSLSVGGSWVMRNNFSTYEDISIEPDPVHLASARVALNSNNVNVSVEYAFKDQAMNYSGELGKFVNQSGDAILVNIDYILDGFGVSGAFRRLEHMEFRADNEPIMSPIVALNYIPALTKQHKYALPGLYPYIPNIEGEIGGQVDLFWDISAGRYPIKTSLNASMYRTLGPNVQLTMPFFGEDGEQLYTEAGIEMERRFSRTFKSTLGFYFQDRVDLVEGRVKSYTEFVDLLWRINRKTSFRTEVQHMNTQMKDKSWIYGLVEVGFAPHLMVYTNGMYNYGAESDVREFFYNVGGSYTYKSLRASIDYGKNKAGNQCVGGICRFVPGYTGATVTLTYVF